MAIPDRVNRLPGEIWKRLWRWRTLVLLGVFPFDWYVAPWLEKEVKPWLENQVGLVPDALVFLADHPWLIPAIVVAIALLVILVHAYVSAGRPEPDAPSRMGEGTSPSGDLGSKPIRVDREVPEEEVNAQWDAECEFVSAPVNDPFGRGVRLSITGKEDEPLDLRCIVIGPNGERFASVARDALGGRPEPRAYDQFHFPGEFRPKLDEPWPPGYYRYVWTGDTAELFDNQSKVLARRFFHVDDDGNITCHKAVPGGGGIEGTVYKAPPGEARICTEGPIFEVCIEEQDWRTFGNTRPPTLALLARVRIRNLTDKERRHHGVETRSTEGLGGVLDTYVEHPLANWLARAHDFLGLVGPQGIEERWIGRTFKHRPQGGTPAYTLTVLDAVGNRYQVDVPEREPETYS